MNAMTPTPASTRGLTERAMLVSLTIHNWRATKLDRVVTEEVAARYQADRHFGRYSKRLLPKDALKEVNGAARALREFHRRETLPWADNGPRILPSANFLRYTDTLRDLRADFDRAARAFVEAYPDFRDAAQSALGGLYRPEDYPAPDEVAAHFGVDVDYSPLPSGADFRVQLGDEVTDRIRADIENRTNEGVRDAVRDLVARAEDAVRRLRDRAAALDGEDRAVFRSALSDTLRGVADLMGRLNITEDPEVEALRRRIESDLLSVEPDTIRTDPQVRGKVRQDADAILNAMAAYTGGA